MISSLILNGGFPDSDSLPEKDDSEVEEIQKKCGLNFLPAAGGCDDIDSDYDDKTIYTLMGIYVAAGCVAFAIIVFLIDALEAPAKENTSVVALKISDFNFTETWFLCGNEDTRDD